MRKALSVSSRTLVLLPLNTRQLSCRSERNKVDNGGEGGRRVVLEEGKELKVVVANLKGEKKAKEEGGAVAKVGSVGEGCGGPKFIEKAGDNAGRQRGQYVCYICTGILE